MLLNLVLNSMRAVSEAGWIEISGRTGKNQNEVVLAVADNGCGIRREDLSSIFEPGFSLRAGSPGLGLAVCRKIVEQHGGTIQVESRPGRGVTFLLTFPLSVTAGGTRP